MAQRAASGNSPLATFVSQPGYKGQIAKDVFIDDSLSNPASIELKPLEYPDSVWWVQIRDNQGQIGWSNESENFVYPGEFSGISLDETYLPSPFAFLSFPLTATCAGHPCTPFTAKVSAVQDHSVPTGYNCHKKKNCDGIIRAYDGEEGREEFGKSSAPSGYKNSKQELETRTVLRVCTQLCWGVECLSPLQL